MLSKQEVSAEKDRLENLKDVVETFEEIAAARMRKSRSSILNYRDFVTGLTTMFQEVKATYRHEIERLRKKNKGKRFSLVAHNGRDVAVLLSANTGLHGYVVKKTFNLFADYVSKNQCDIVVVGRLGRFYFQQQFPQKKFTYFDFPDYRIDLPQLRIISKYLLQYEKLLVFFGNFKSISTQEPKMLTIADLNEVEASEPGKRIDFLSEPSIEKMVEFFEREIFSSIIEQALHDSDLAKLASRMYSLDMATDNIKTSLRKVDLQSRLINHKIMNQKQQSILSGMSLWGNS